jgi:hypothetical protein
MARDVRSAGVEEQSMSRKDCPRNLGDPAASGAIEARGLRHRRSTDEEPANSNSPLARDAMRY